MCTNRQANRLRDSKGCFVSINSAEGAHSRRERQLAYNARNHVIAGRVFEKLVDVGFLKGEKLDWIPSSTAEGPFVMVVESIVKKRFLLSRQERAKLLRSRYFDGKISKRHEHLPKRQVIEASNPNGPKKVIRVYRGRRLPFLQRGATEMKAVRAWIDFVDSKNALAVATVDDAYEVFRKAIKSYVWVRSKRFYVGYPKLLQPREEQQTLTRSDPQSRQQTREETLELPSTRDQIAQFDPRLPRSCEEDEDRRDVMHHTMKMVEAAQNDRIFYFLCSVLDEKRFCFSGIYAACALQPTAADRRYCNNILVDILEYSRAIYSGIKDKEQHLARKERMTMMMDALKALRKVRNLRSYDEMTWDSVVDKQARLSCYGPLALAQGTHVPAYLGRRAQQEGPAALRENLVENFATDAPEPEPEPVSSLEESAEV